MRSNLFDVVRTALMITVVWGGIVLLGLPIGFSVACGLAVIPFVLSYVFQRSGIWFLKRGRNKHALLLYSAATILDPLNGCIYSNRGILHYEANRFDNAIRCFSISLTLGSKHPRIFKLRGFAYGITGRLEQAIEDITKAIHGADNAAELYAYRSDLHLAMSEWCKEQRAEELELAMKDADQAIAMSPECPDMSKQREKVLAELGES